MNYKSMVLVVIALLGIGFFPHETQAKINRKPKEEVAKMSCTEMQSYITQEAIQALRDCQTKLGLNTQADRKGKLLCILKCIGIEEGFLNEDGTVSKEGIDKFIEDHVPERFHQYIHPVLDECVFGQNIEIDPNDEFCKSYEPIMKCVMSKIGQVDLKTLCDKYAKEFAEGK